MSFTFGCAKALYARQQHPRLLCGPEDLPRLRQALSRGPGRRFMDAFRRRVRPQVRGVEAAGDLAAELIPDTKPGRPRPAQRLGAVFSNLPCMAFVAVLDEDARALAAVQRVLTAIPTAEKRGAQDRLSLGYSARGMTQIPYDLVGHTLPTAERAAITAWLLKASLQDVLPVLRQRHYLRCSGMNIPMAGMMTALLSLLAIKGDPGVPDLAAEETELLHFLEATLNCVVGPNGYPDEDIGYGTLMVGELAFVVEAVRRAGLFDAYRDCPRYAEYGNAMLHFVQPWGKFLSNTGDYAADCGIRSLVLPRLAAETGNRALMWLDGTLSYPIGSAGPMDIKAARRAWPEIRLGPGFQVPVDVGSLLTLPSWPRRLHPSRTRIPTQFMDPGRGIVTFRSSWKADATFVVFDGSQRSPSAQGHAHDSGGHFSLSALGEYFALDTGRYNIDQDQHNVVLVDGRSGVSTGGDWRASWYQARLTGYRPGRFVDTATVNSSQMSDCYWAKRTLGLVKDPTGNGAPAYVWTAEDINKANDFREFWWALNMHPRHRAEIDASHAVITGCDRGSMLEVHFVLPPPTAFPKPHTLTVVQDYQQYGSHKYTLGEGTDPAKVAADYQRLTGHLEYGPVFRRPRLLGKVAGYNGRFLALMIPRRKGTPPATVETLDSLDNSLAVRIRMADVEDILIWAYEHQLLEAEDVRARGSWCVVRRSLRTGAVLAWEIADGRQLEVGGRRLRTGGR